MFEGRFCIRQIAATLTFCGDVDDEASQAAAGQAERFKAGPPKIVL
jgi:hypothetical protein